MIQPVSSWTNERTEILRSALLRGLSAGQTGKLLNISRSACQSKAMRLGLRFGARPGRHPNNQPPAAPRPKTLHPWRGSGGTPPVPPVAVAVPPSALQLMDLKPWHCRWPLGDPASPAFGFCGHARDGERVYCADHARIAYVPSMGLRDLQRSVRRYG